MSKLAQRIVDLPLDDDIDAAIDATIRTAGGDVRTAVGALIEGQRSLMEFYAGVISAGYVRRGGGRR